MSNHDPIVLRRRDPETGQFVWRISMRCKQCPDILENDVGLENKKDVPQIIARMDAMMEAHYKKAHSAPYIIIPGGKA